MKDRYVEVFRRRREGKTDYKKRRALIISRLPFISVFISSKFIYSQLSVAEPKGDKVIASANSKQLLKLGWKGSGKSLPACYLTGLLLGKKGKQAGIDEAILYTGLRAYRKGSRISAFVKGVVDSGLALRVEEESLPEEERLKGEHIKAYAEELKKQGPDYLKRFSSLLASGFSPEHTVESFEAVKAKIMEGVAK